jgi:hypothetical protein
VVHQKLWNKAWDVRNKEIGRLEETRDKNMNRAHRNWWYTAPVPRSCELEFEQPGGSQDVPYGGKWRGENGA